MYAVLGTRLDIMFTVTFLSQFMQNSGHPHWEEVKHVFHYLKGTIGWMGTGGHWRWVKWGKQDQPGLEDFSDADDASQHHWHSIFGYIFTINSWAVSWSLKKQPIIALSMTEAKYIAATHTAKGVLWIQMFLSEVTHPLTHPITLYCDNQSTISISKNDQFHTWMKHINFQYHFICNVSEQELISIHYCPTVDMPTDMLTKALPASQLTHLCHSIGLHSA